jgi:hypothetical protein
MVRRCKRRRVAPVVIDVRGGSYNTSVGGERDLAQIREMAKLGGRSPEMGKTAAALGKIRREGEASGGQRRRYGRENGGEGGGAREGGRSGVGDEGVDEWLGHVRTARSAARQRGEKEGRGGVWQRGHHATRGAWSLAPTGWRHPDRGPAVGGRGSEKREARRAWAGPGRKRVDRAQMNSTVLDLFKLIQTGSNYFDKRGTYQAPKIPIKIWIERA